MSWFGSTNPELEAMKAHNARLEFDATHYRDDSRQETVERHKREADERRNMAALEAAAKAEEEHRMGLIANGRLRAWAAAQATRLIEQSHPQEKARAAREAERRKALGYPEPSAPTPEEYDAIVGYEPTTAVGYTKPSSIMYDANVILSKFR
jgi:hypothetical protein